MRDYDPTDASSQEQAREADAIRAKLLSDEERSDIQRLMSLNWGRRIVWRQLERAGVFRLSFSSDAMQMAFAEGCRNEGLRLLATINETCPKHYMTMMKEQADARNPDNA